jgi:hypothetical protein
MPRVIPSGDPVNQMADSNPNKLVGMILGVVLVLVGIIGFVPALITNKALLGIFGVNTLHNIVHLLTGAVLLAGAYMDGGRNARMVNMVLGIVYALVAIVGFLQIQAINDLLYTGKPYDGLGGYADALLHGLLAVVLLAVSFTMKEDTMMASKM